MNFTCTDLCTFLYHARLLRYHSDLIRVGCHTLRSLKLFLRTNSINDFLGKIPMKREEYMRLMELNQRLKGCHEDVETSHDRNCEEAKYSENCPYENRVFNTIPCSQLMSSIHLWQTCPLYHLHLILCFCHHPLIYSLESRCLFVCSVDFHWAIIHRPIVWSFIHARPSISHLPGWMLFTIRLRRLPVIDVMQQMALIHWSVAVVAPELFQSIITVEGNYQNVTRIRLRDWLITLHNHQIILHQSQR